MAALTLTDMLAPNTGYNITANAITTGQADTIDISSAKDQSLAILIVNGSTVAGTATISAGVGSESSQGALALTLPASGNVATTIESARFKNADGAITITVAGATSGSIYAMELPY